MEMENITLEQLGEKAAQKRRDLGLDAKESSTISSSIQRATTSVPEAPPRCPECKFFPALKVGEKLLPCEECRGVVPEPTAEQKQQAKHDDRQRSVRDNLQRIGVNVRKYVDDTPATFDTFIATPDKPARNATQQFVREFTAGERPGLYLFGKRPESRLAPGNGKTMLAVSALRELVLDPDIKVNDLRFIFVPRLLLEIQDTFDAPERRTVKIVDKYVEPELLVWDDFGAEKLSDFAVRTLYTILYEREGRSNIFTSNLSLEDVESRDSYNERMTSRIAGSCRLVELVGPDRRMMRRSA